MAVRNITVSENGHYLIVDPVDGWRHYQHVGALDIRNVSVAVREGLDGTYVDVTGTLNTRDRSLGEDWTRRYFYPNNAVLYVRTSEQKQTWDHFLEELRRELYESRDVLPPQHPTR